MGELLTEITALKNWLVDQSISNDLDFHVSTAQLVSQWTRNGEELMSSDNLSFHYKHEFHVFH